MNERSRGSLPERPRQVLPPAAYTEADWFAREQKQLFARAWTFAGALVDFAAPGDYATARAGPAPLAVVRGEDGILRGFHNLCRHRGTELLEGAGNAGKTLVCPYHAWTYDLAGGLKAIANRASCFPDLDPAGLGLHPAAVGTFGGLVFVHPDPAADFAAWCAPLKTVAWPHDPAALSESDAVTYEMNCNWKVFYENAIDGYHLRYLHKNTLGGPGPDANLWEAHGEHLLWYATDREDRRSSLPGAVATALAGWSQGRIDAAAADDYAGVYMLFPATIVVANPYGFSVSQLLPAAPGRTLLRTRAWGIGPGAQAADAAASPTARARDPVTGHVRLALLDIHALQSGDFQLEDMWICESMQRALHAPMYAVAGLARGAGGEAPLAFFQQCVRDYLDA